MSDKTIATPIREELVSLYQNNLKLITEVAPIS